LKKTRLDIAEDLHKLFPELSEARTLRPIVNALVDLFIQYLEQNNSIHLARFGTFEARTRKPRQILCGINGCKVSIPERRVPTFRSTNHLRKRLNRTA